MLLKLFYISFAAISVGSVIVTVIGLATLACALWGLVAVAGLIAELLTAGARRLREAGSLRASLP